MQFGRHFIKLLVEEKQDSQGFVVRELACEQKVASFILNVNKSQLKSQLRGLSTIPACELTADPSVCELVCISLMCSLQGFS